MGKIWLKQWILVIWLLILNENAELHWPNGIGQQLVLKKHDKDKKKVKLLLNQITNLQVINLDIQKIIDEHSKIILGNISRFLMNNRDI